jgi:hypothetical protein
MSALSRYRARRQQRRIVHPRTLAPKPDNSNVVTRFLTHGGATVELRAKRFATRTHPVKGRPDVLDEPYQVDGYDWDCLGCGAGSQDRSYWDEQGYLPKEQREARDDANDHASVCRATPKPEVSR